MCVIIAERWGTEQESGNSGYADQYQVYWINKRDVNNNPKMLGGAQSDVSPDAQSMICFSFSSCMDELPLGIEIVFSENSVNFSLFSDVPDATVELMPHFMSNDEPQQFKLNIAEVNPTLWSPEKIKGVQPVIDHLLKQGVIVPTHSPYNAPINPIRKADGTSWHLM